MWVTSHDAPIRMHDAGQTGLSAFTTVTITPAGKCSASVEDLKGAGVPEDGISRFAYSSAITGRFNKAGTRVTGTWHAHLTAYSAAYPTGLTVLDTCDSGTVKFAANRS